MPATGANASKRGPSTTRKPSRTRGIRYHPRLGCPPDPVQPRFFGFSRRSISETMLSKSSSALEMTSTPGSSAGSRFRLGATGVWRGKRRLLLGRQIPIRAPIEPLSIANRGPAALRSSRFERRRQLEELPLSNDCPRGGRGNQNLALRHPDLQGFAVAQLLANHSDQAIRKLGGDCSLCV